MEMIKVKAVQGRDTLMEDGREWPSGSVLVEKTHYIRRRLADGDIVEVGAKKPSPEAAPQSKSEQVKGDK